MFIFYAVVEWYGGVYGCSLEIGIFEVNRSNAICCQKKALSL